MNLRTRQRLVVRLGLLGRRKLNLRPVGHPTGEGFLRKGRTGGWRRRKRHCGNDILLLPAQRFVRGAHDGPADRSLVSELHLRLGWMHIDIDGGRVNLNANHTQGMSTNHEEGVESLFQGIGQRPVLHESPVDEEEEILAM